MVDELDFEDEEDREAEDGRFGTVVRAWDEVDGHIAIYYDEDGSSFNPRKEEDHLSTLIMQKGDHSMGDEEVEELEFTMPCLVCAGNSEDGHDDCHFCQSGEMEVKPETYFRVRNGARVVLPVYDWGENLSKRISLSGRRRDQTPDGYVFDSRAGRELLGFSGEETLEEIKQILISEIEEYDHWLVGEVFFYRVVSKDGKEDSCGGFIGDIKYVEDSAREALRGLTGREATSEERAHWAGDQGKKAEPVKDSEAEIKAKGKGVVVGQPGQTGWELLEGVWDTTTEGEFGLTSTNGMWGWCALQGEGAGDGWTFLGNDRILKATLPKAWVGKLGAQMEADFPNGGKRVEFLAGLLGIGEAGDPGSGKVEFLAPCKAGRLAKLPKLDHGRFGEMEAGKGQRLGVLWVKDLVESEGVTNKHLAVAWGDPEGNLIGWEPIDNMDQARGEWEGPVRLERLGERFEELLISSQGQQGEVDEKGGFINKWPEVAYQKGGTYRIRATDARCVMGWWEPGMSAGEGQDWLIVQSQANPGFMRIPEHSQAWRLHMPDDFDGVLRPVHGIGMSSPNNDYTLVGKAEMGSARGQGVVRGQFFELEEGPTPELPRLENQYPLVPGPYCARGMLLTEERVLQVLWETHEGVPAGWEPVNDWADAKDLEKRGLANPGDLGERQWWRLRKMLGEAYHKVAEGIEI